MGVTKSQVEIFLGGVQNLFGGLYEEISRTKGVIRRGIKKQVIYVQVYIL